MPTYRQRLEAQVVGDLREWLDSVEARYGPNYAIESYAFVGAIGFTPNDEEVDVDDAFARTAVSYHSSDSRQWAQIGLFRKALLMAEEDDAD